ncbi:glycosyltransferase family 4 protein [Pseudomonas sp. GW456-12-1-14-TSB6]|uniref:MraY family glycosyltransferase n=2 Tax=Pseudomonas sp. GW456-12-1-14-TSB6 TaxID=2751350 RepID=UPI001A90CDFB|nr:glycosyltransferase family 4 protein [Pseudomonas sp. GW456-12-1-14-TSB6]
MILGWVLLVVFGASWLLTLLLRRYALSKSLMDIPNARSSHSVPTPRGGGVAIVFSFICALPVVLMGSVMSMEQFVALLGSGLLIALIGFADDHGHIAARWRLLGHFIGGVWGLYWLGGLGPISIFGSAINLGWLGNFIALIYVVWMLNLYNFMDGIDGLASIEAICACLGASLIFWITGNYSLILAPLILAFAVAGFCWWNFPPARIFMGDAGSGFLGVTLAILSIYSAWTSSALLFVWLIMLGVFIVDATLTLLRRLVRGDAVYEAHRSHAYQFASRQLKSHKKVTFGVAAINVFWLWPMALIVGKQWMDPVLGVFISYLPLIALAIFFKGGSLERKETAV